MITKSQIEFISDYKADTVPEFKVSQDNFQRCLRCGRRLKDAVSRERGYGDTCYAKKSSEKAIKLF